MIPAFVLVAALSARQPAHVTPLRPGELREIGGPIEAGIGSWGSDRWGCFGRESGYGVRRGGFGRSRYGYGGGHRGGGRGRR